MKVTSINSICRSDVINLTSVNGLVTGQVALVAEGSLAAVTLVWLVTVDLSHMVFQGIFCEFGVTITAEVGVVFCGGRQFGIFSTFSGSV